MSKSIEWPRKVICLTAETTEILFALGAGERIVGVSGYSVRPPEARLKEKVSAFTSARMEKIRGLQPDLIFAFSDLQKDIVAELTQEGFNVFVTNQRSLQEVSDTIIAVGRLVGLEKEAVVLAGQFESELEELGRKAAQFPRRLRVYFEEWDDPLISGIKWAGEMIRKLGGEDIFQELEQGRVAKDRCVLAEQVIERNPEVVLASWCGKKVQIENIRSRTGWDQIEAVRRNQIYEIKSADILQPGLSLLYGARRMFEIFNGIHTLERRGGPCVHPSNSELKGHPQGVPPR